MKIYKTQNEIEKDIKDGELYIDGDVKFECSFVIAASIRVTGNIDAHNINAHNIDAHDINAHDIDAHNINALNIDALNIDARNIDAYDIDAHDINYYAVCSAYTSFICDSVEGGRENSKHFCLDSDIEYREKEEKESDTIMIRDGKKYKVKVIKEIE
jgi:hypothetical protein